MFLLINPRDLFPFAATLVTCVFQLKPKKKIYICVFQVSQPYLCFCPDPKHFIVDCEQNVVRFAENGGKI